MKVHFEVDCTPSEARAFFGLPDVAPVQEALLKQMQERMSATLSGMDGEALLKMWLPTGMQGMEQLQKMWQQFAGGFGGKGGRGGGAA